MDGLVFVGKPSRAFKLFPADLWFEVIDYLSVLDIVRLRAVSVSLTVPQFARLCSVIDYPSMRIRYPATSIESSRRP